LLAKLPLVPAVREGGDLGMPVVARHPDSEVAKEFRKLGRTVAQSIEVMTRKHGAPSPEIQIGKF
jgi:ATP-binding protein involved in chromosome partitioning